MPAVQLWIFLYGHQIEVKSSFCMSDVVRLDSRSCVHSKKCQICARLHAFVHTCMNILPAHMACLYVRLGFCRVTGPVRWTRCCAWSAEYMVT